MFFTTMSTNNAKTANKSEFINHNIKASLDMNKCENIVNYEGISNYIVSNAIVCTASSGIHCKSAAEKIERFLKDNGIKFVSSLQDPEQSNDWVVIDCESESLMIHCMTESQREYYKIDTLLTKISKNQLAFENKAKSDDRYIKYEAKSNDDEELSNIHFLTQKQTRDEVGIAKKSPSKAKTGKKTVAKKAVVKKVVTKTKSETKKSVTKSTNAKDENSLKNPVKKTVAKKTTTKVKAATKPVSEKKAVAKKSTDKKVKSTAKTAKDENSTTDTIKKEITKKPVAKKAETKKASVKKTSTKAKKPVAKKVDVKKNKNNS